MTLSKDIIALIRKYKDVKKHECICEDGKVLTYYTLDCAGVHIAVWPHWNVVSGLGVHKRFYLFNNPAYRYLHSYKIDIDTFEVKEKSEV